MKPHYRRFMHLSNALRMLEHQVAEYHVLFEKVTAVSLELTEAENDLWVQINLVEDQVALIKSELKDYENV